MADEFYRIKTVRLDGAIYLNQRDVVAFLKDAAMDYSDSPSGNTLMVMATMIENMKMMEGK